MAGNVAKFVRAGWGISAIIFAIVVGLLLPFVPGAAGLKNEVPAGTNGSESTWQGTWYALVDTGTGPECVGTIGTDSWSSTFAKDWGTDDVFGDHSDNLCFAAQITIYVRQSGAYRFDFKNVDDGARLYDASGDLLFSAICGFLNCPTQYGEDVNLQKGKAQLGLQYWELAGRASISFLAVDKSIFSNSAPTVSFTYSPATVLAGDSVAFSAIAVDPDGDSMTYSWTIGTVSYSQRNPTHSFASAGTYRVVLTVTDEFGAAGSASQDILVRARPPIASVSASPASGQAPLDVSFTCSAVDGTSPYSFEWNFGDGSATGSGPQVTHVYSNEGTFIATCTVRDSSGELDTSSISVSVSAAPPTGVAPFGLDGSSFFASMTVVGAAVVAAVLLQYRRMRRRRASPPVK